MNKSPFCAVLLVAMSLFLPLRAQAITITPVDFDAITDSAIPEYSFGEVPVGETGFRTASFDVTCTAEDYYCLYSPIFTPTPGAVFELLGAPTSAVDCRLCGDKEAVTRRWSLDFRVTIASWRLDPYKEFFGIYSFKATSATTGSLQQDYILSAVGVPAPVPIPPALWLFGSGLLGLVGVARRKASA